MAKQLKEIEIPFGAKDSELCSWEYTIPEGMEATIVDNKIVVKKKVNEDDKEYDVCDTCDEKASCVNPCPVKLIEEEKPIEEMTQEEARAAGRWLERWGAVQKELASKQREHNMFVNNRPIRS